MTLKLHIMASALAGALFLGIGAANALEEESAPTAWQSHEVQRGIKRANEGVVALGIFQIVITGLGTFGVLWSMHLSRAALAQARASADIQRDVAREELRGYLSAEIPIVEAFDDELLRVNYIVRNVGKTPVKNVRMWSASKVVPGKRLSYELDPPVIPTEDTPRTVPPGGTVGFGIHRSLTTITSNALAASESTLVTAYFITYEDIFGDERSICYSELRRGPGLIYRRFNEDYALKHAAGLITLPPIPDSLKRPEPQERPVAHALCLRRFHP